MKQTAKILALVVIICMASISLFAGGQEEAAAESEAGAESVSTVTLWNRVFEDWNNEYHEMRGNQYNEAGRGVILEQEFVPGDAWNEKVTAAKASATMPDTYFLAYNGIIPAASRGEILAIDDLFSAEAIDMIYDNVKDMIRYEGKLYAYPELIEPATILYYRTDLFEEAGLTAPPKTWSEMADYAVKLNSDDVFGLSIPGFGVDMSWSTWGWQQSDTGHMAVSDNWDAPNIDDYGPLAELWKELYDRGAVPEQPLGGYPDIRPFLDGHLAMAFCGSWGVASLFNDYPDMVDKVAIAVAPTRDGNQNKTTSTNGGWTYVIDAKADNVDGAVDYINWALVEDPDRAAEYFRLANYAKSPASSAVMDALEASAGDNVFLKTINSVASKAVAEPMYPWDISMTVSLMFENVAMGFMTAEEAIEDAKLTISQIIDNQGIAGKNPKN